MSIVFPFLIFSVSFLSSARSLFFFCGRPLFQGGDICGLSILYFLLFSLVDGVEVDKLDERGGGMEKEEAGNEKRTKGWRP